MRRQRIRIKISFSFFINKGVIHPGTKFFLATQKIETPKGMKIFQEIGFQGENGF